jgi:hypothetical protein
MKNGTLSLHRKTKFGMLPGDVPLDVKIEMLEKGTVDREEPKRARAFKKAFAKMANRRVRHTPIEE